MLWQCLWKLSCLNYTIACGSQAVRMTQLKCKYINFLIRQISLKLIEKKTMRDSEQFCVSLPAKNELRDWGSMPVSPTEAHTNSNICLTSLRGIKLNHYSYVSINHFILQKNLAKNSVFKGIYRYYGFNTVALIHHPSVFFHWNRIGGSCIKIRYAVTCQMMWY